MLLLVGFAFFTFGCASSAETEDPLNVTPAHVFYDSHNGQEVSVNAGDIFFVKLKETPSSGYRWKVEPYDFNYLLYKGKKFQSDSDDPEDVAASGVQIFGFEARRKGTTELKFTQVGPGIENNAEYSLKITIN